MNKQYRTPVIAGNWKMNHDRPATRAMIEELLPLIAGSECEVVLCVPYTDLETAISLAKGTNLAIGAQNCHWAEKGAFTGEISAAMLKEMGCDYVIVGHSERRQYFGDTNQTVNERLKAAIAVELPVILCVGENLEQREAGQFEQVVALQLTDALEGVTPEQMQLVTVAYEPVWAIGTGKNATPAQAAEACALLRGVLWGLMGPTVAVAVPLLYGGSMNEKNCAELLEQVDVDGGLIGGASLKAASFAQIVATADRMEDTGEETGDMARMASDGAGETGESRGQ